jgi:hypothetical protein
MVRCFAPGQSDGTTPREAEAGARLLRRQECGARDADFVVTRKRR